MGKKGKRRAKDREHQGWSGPDRAAPGMAAQVRDGGAAHGSVGGGSASSWMAAPQAHDVARQLSSLGLRLVRESAQGEGPTGLTAARLSVLGQLLLGGPRRLGSLARAERVRPPTMTRLVTALEEEGLVARERGGEDGRSVVVRATEAGGVAFQEGVEHHAGALAGRLATLSMKRRAAVAEAAAVIEAALEDGGQAALDAGPDLRERHGGQDR